MASIVIAIDFGTTGSGFAYVYAHEPDKAHMHDAWPKQPGASYVKTATQLLYTPDGEHLLQWGWPAVEGFATANANAPRPPPVLGASEETLRRLAEQRARELPRLVRNFKMQIKEGGKRGSEATYDDEHGRTWSVRRLVADYLRELRVYLLAFLRSGKGADVLPDSEIRWCLTVPAIWTETEKQFMRRAARDAGLIAGPDDDRLTIVLEPEAAAVACIKDKRIALADGESFMLVDAGGGTVDITVHQIKGGALREVCQGSGAMCGATYLDAEFTRFIRDLLGAGTFDRLVNERPMAWLGALRHWENAKRAYGPGYTTFHLPIEMAFMKLVRQERPDFEAELARMQGGVDDAIVLSADRMDKIFRPVLDDVVSAVRRQFQILGSSGAPPLQNIVLVGGFSESKALQQRIQAEFGGKVRRVLAPERPGSTILYGAALLGFDAGRIVARAARMTYGCKASMPFELQDPESSKVWSDTDNRYLCNQRFSQMVTIGQQIAVNEQVTESYHTVHKHQSTVQFDFYSTPARSARYVPESGMSRIGSITVTLKRPTEAAQSVQVRMYFGQAEIRVEAIDGYGGKAECQLKLEW